MGRRERPARTMLANFELTRVPSYSLCMWNLWLLGLWFPLNISCLCICLPFFSLFFSLELYVFLAASARFFVFSSCLYIQLAFFVFYDLFIVVLGIWVCLIYLYAPRAGLVPMDVSRGHQIPLNWVIDRCWEWNPRLLQEHKVPLNTAILNTHPECQNSFSCLAYCQQILKFVFLLCMAKSPSSILGLEILPMPDPKNPPIPGLFPSSGLEIPPNHTLEISTQENSSSIKA